MLRDTKGGSECLRRLRPFSVNRLSQPQAFTTLWLQKASEACSFSTRAQTTSDSSANNTADMGTPDSTRWKKCIGIGGGDSLGESERKSHQQNKDCLRPPNQNRTSRKRTRTFQKSKHTPLLPRVMETTDEASAYSRTARRARGSSQRPRRERLP